MNLKELLLKGQNFMAILNQFRIDANDFFIKDEEVIFSNGTSKSAEIVKESVCIEGKSKEGAINLFGTLHYNLLSKLAVFEMQGYERTPLAS